MKKKPRIYLTRDSVCLGDDFSAPHEREWILKNENDLLGIINQCKADYLPTNIQGNNPGWIAKSGQSNIAVVAQNWKEAKLISTALTIESIKNEKGNVVLHFEYLKEHEPEDVFRALSENA